MITAGCAHGPVRVGAVAGAPSRSVSNAATRPSGQVTGVWDWVLRSNDDQGNLRVEQEEWHLVQRGRAIEGYYDRALTLLSLDDHLFRCNQQLGITKFTRVRVAGSVDGMQVRVQEVGFDARPGPCDDGSRSLNQYTGEVADSTLRLQWSDRLGEQTLLKRPRAGGPRLAELVGIEQRPPPELGLGSGEAPRTDSGLLHPGVPIHGVFLWDLKTIDAEGDVRVDHEEWHLDEQDAPAEPRSATIEEDVPASLSVPTAPTAHSTAQLKGYYVRTVKRSRDGGVYLCNGLSSQETSVRFEISGHRTAAALVLVETSYHADHSRCENGLRRLDTYRGSISDTGNEVVLSWESGNQVLRRAPAARTSDSIPANAPPTGN